jgi:hypothetical protein
MAFSWVKKRNMGICRKHFNSLQIKSIKIWMINSCRKLKLIFNAKNCANFGNFGNIFLMRKNNLCSFHIPDVTIEFLFQKVYLRGVTLAQIGRKN